MSKKRKKIDFIRQNQNLTLMELALRTGFTETQVGKFLEAIREEKNLQPTSNPIFLIRKNLWVFSSFLVLTVVLFYLPVLKNDFIDWDDGEMITKNLKLYSSGLSSFGWMFSTNSGGLWIPITFFSFAMNYWMGGLDPRIFHLTNVLFHSLNTMLVFHVCKRVLEWGYLTRETSKGYSSPSIVLPTSFLTALLFGLHPIHVESVAWAAERKDVLYAFFYLLGLLVYLGKPSLKTTIVSGREEETLANKVTARNSSYYKLFILLGLYLLALMSKPMAVTLPLVFLILDYWPLKRLQKDFIEAFKEKIPFFVLALLVSLVTKFGMGQISRINNNLSLLFRVMHSFYSLAFYFYKIIAPFELVPVYPFPHVVTYIYYLKASLALFLVVLISIFLFFYRKKFPYLTVTWLYYLVTLAPVIGFVQVGSFAEGDRYTYLPSLGLFLPFSAGIAILFLRRFVIFWLFCLSLGLSLGYATVQQIGVWKDQESVSACVTKAYPVETRDSEMRYGDELLNKGKVDNALKHYQAAAAIPPFQAAPHEQMGNAYMTNGQINDAIGEFKKALEINTTSKEFLSSLLHNQLWNAYEKNGERKEAFVEAQTFLKDNPNDASAYYEMGITYFEEKNYSEAVKALRFAVQLDSNNKMYLDTLASLLVKTGKTEQAIQAYKNGILINPQEPVFYLKLAGIYLDRKNNSQALEMLNTVSHLNIVNPQIFQELGHDYERMGKKDLAEQYYAKAQSLDGVGLRQFQP